MMRVEHLRSMALTCRNLAQSAVDEKTRIAMLRTAEDYDRRAARREALLGCQPVQEPQRGARVPETKPAKGN